LGEDFDVGSEVGLGSMFFGVVALDQRGGLWIAVELNEYLLRNELSSRFSSGCDR
jgi:hypothetical protein